MTKYVVSESVSEGHVDKICDQLSDNILDECLKIDPNSKVACETLITSKAVIIAGEITSHANLDMKKVVHDVFLDIGLDAERDIFDYFKLPVNCLVTNQSAELNKKVEQHHNKQTNFMAGDQGFVFGYACKQTPQYLPLMGCFANQVMQDLSCLRKAKKIPHILSDMKCLVHGKEDINGQISQLTDVKLSVQHTKNIDLKKIKTEIYNLVIKPLLDKFKLPSNFKFDLNPAGEFITGGAISDTGLTGRKINIDNYGGYTPVGGGAFSGKDATKVDRSGAYLARYIAKNLVAADVCSRCQVQLVYMIGSAEPISIFVDCFGTNKIAENKIIDIIRQIFPLSLNRTIEHFQLLKPIYYQTSKYGHFSSEQFPWEKLDAVANINKLL